jgi:DNA polymerase-3 subunit beta
MKLKVNRQELQEALSAVSSVAAQRTPKPILQCLLVEAHADHCLLAATDLELGIRYTVAQVEVSDQGRIVVPADKLAQIVRESADEILDVHAEDSICHVRGQGAHFQIYTQDAADFPPVAELSGDADFEVDAPVLRRMAEWTVFAAARENTRYAINGVLWEKEGQGLALVATDGRRMSMARAALEAAGEGKIESIVPVKAMSLLQRTLGSGDGGVGIKLVGTQLIARMQRATISTALVEGRFPDYRVVIPKEHDRVATMENSALLSALRRAALLTNQESKGVRLSFDTGQLTISSRAPAQGEATIELPIQYEGQPVEIGFNPHFLIEPLKNAHVDEVRLELKASNQPGLLRISDDLLYVVMPVNLS